MNSMAFGCTKCQTEVGPSCVSLQWNSTSLYRIYRFQDRSRSPVGTPCCRFRSLQAVARPFGSVAPYIVLLARFCSGFDNGTRQVPRTRGDDASGRDVMFAHRFPSVRGRRLNRSDVCYSGLTKMELEQGRAENVGADHLPLYTGGCLFPSIDAYINVYYIYIYIDIL